VQRALEFNHNVNYEATIDHWRLWEAVNNRLVWLAIEKFLVNICVNMVYNKN